MKKIFGSCIGLLIVIIIFVVLKLTNSYTIEKATDNGDFINYPEQTNIESFNEFITNVNNHVNSKIRITEYSKEGVPKVNDLTYDNNVIVLHSFYPNSLFNKKKITGEYTEIYFESTGDDKDMYLINSKLGTKTYICQIRNFK
ncbi:DUF4362 domain-containing protein [Anaerocolumna sedimenticola]|uniref:DUF4362 domain-containing protein n=1 Tax=Anaerocolumna sedimenticola TaxID=2696063 RepID=A0A6P1TSW7_9FIRM|nr:DUF4362 domain-containing protein [Anaerocolumna sedimenticola]QHQ63299.1 DUF4362 domain-containing protein [Anaerocolumna sedimenticola]